MALKKRSGVSADFSIASATDVIFLLLLFFMLTSTLVKIEPFKLPESDSKTVAPVDVILTIEKNGDHKLNNEPIDPTALARALSAIVLNAEDKSEATLTIVAEIGTPFVMVVDAMEAAATNKYKAILATQPKS